MTDQGTSDSNIRVLLMAPNWLGDTVMFSPLLTFLDRHRVFPDGRRLVLEMAVRPAWSPLFRHDQRIDYLLPVEREGRHGGLLGGWKLGNDFKRREPATRNPYPATRNP